MTVITHPRRKSRLAAMIDSAGGVSVGVALARARANVEAMRSQAMRVVDQEIGRLEAVPAPTGADDAPARLAQAYDAATAVIDAAGPFELPELCAAAAGLCDLLSMAGAEAFDWRVVTVHARALRLLQTLPPEAIEPRARILESLGSVVARKRPQTD